MPPLTHIDKTRIGQQLPSVLLEAVVLDPVTDADGWLRVEAAGQPGAVKLCPWMPRLDMAVMPGDAVLIVESDQGNYWCVQWWPQNGQVSVTPGAALPALGAGQGWVGPLTTPTDIATQAELDAEATSRSAADVTLTSAVGAKADASDSRFPTASEKAALAGTNGSPGSGNKYVTDSDPRLSSTGGATRAFAIAVAS